MKSSKNVTRKNKKIELLINSIIKNKIIIIYLLLCILLKFSVTLVTIATA